MDLFKKIQNQTFSALSIRNYRLYFIGQGVSLCGTWMQTIAQDWLVLTLSHSATMLGLVTAFQFLPVLIFGPLGGVIADRFPKRKILFITQSAAGLLALIFGILVFTHLIQIWIIFVLAPILGLINTVDNPTRQTFVFEMVGREDLTNAVTLNSTEVNLARVIGPSIAGALIATVGMATCFFLNSISYIAVLFMLFYMDTKTLHPTKLAKRSTGQVKEGLSYIWTNPLLRNTLIMMAIVGTLSYEFSVTLPVLIQTTFHGNVQGYATLTAAFGIGSVIGGLIAANMKKRSVKILAQISVLFSLSIFFVSLAPNVLIATIAMVIVGIFSLQFISFGNTILQLESLPEMRGRVMAIWTVAFLGSTPIGGPIVGFIAEYAGPRWSLALGGFAALIAAGIGFHYEKNRLSQFLSQQIVVRTQEMLAEEEIHT